MNEQEIKEMLERIAALENKNAELDSRFAALEKQVDRINKLVSEITENRSIKTAVNKTEAAAAQTVPLPAGQEKDGLSRLREKAENHLALFEYGKAVQLIEENERLCADPSFNKVKTRLLIHYTEAAKSYFSKTAEFITRQKINGKDMAALFDENGRLPANALSDSLTFEEKTVLDRVAISRRGYMDYSVSIEIFGIQAVYPAEDIILDPVTPPAGGYTDPALLLEEAEKNTALYRYAAAVRLIEENPQLSAAPSLEAVKKRLTEYFTEMARVVYKAALSYVTWQEVQGNTLANGCEGYDKKSRTLDPAHFLTRAEITFISRVKIICTNEKIPEFKVTIDFCGMTAVYPANDVRI